MTIESQAFDRWGEPNRRLSTRSELRFGRQGSVAVQVSGEKAGAWFDFEEGEGGHLDDAVEVQEPAPNAPRLIVAKYDYVAVTGELLYQVCRYMPKDFRPRRPDGSGGWVEGRGCLDGIERVPYRLGELAGSDYAVIVEGEKDADRLADLGIVATTNSGGAQTWAADLNPYFVGKRVYIVPDNDKAGAARVEKVVAALHGVAASVRVCDLCADMPPKCDVSDFLDAGHEVTLELLNGYAEIADPVVDLIDASETFELLAADEISASLGADDFVEDLLITGAMSVVYGPSNCGKTFFASDLALHVALGWRWREREVEQGGVIYIAAEGSHGIKNRVAAFKQHHGLVEGVPLAVLPSTVNMSDAEGDIDKLVNTVRLARERFGRIVLVVVDTLARVMTGNENTAEDMGALINNCDRLRHVTDAHVMLIHHSGKAKEAGARGSSALRAATDTEIEIDKADLVSTAVVTKQRELEVSGEFHFSLDVVELGKNARGKMVTSCVVEPVESNEARQRQRKPAGKQQQLVYAVVKQLSAEAPVRQVFGVDGPRVPVVTETEVRDQVYARLNSDSKHKSTTFNRAILSLVADEFVMKQGEQIWLL